MPAPASARARRPSDRLRAKLARFLVEKLCPVERFRPDAPAGLADRPFRKPLPMGVYVAEFTGPSGELLLIPIDRSGKLAPIGIVLVDGLRALTRTIDAVFDALVESDERTERGGPDDDDERDSAAAEIAYGALVASLAEIGAHPLELAKASALVAA